MYVPKVGMEDRHEFAVDFLVKDGKFFLVQCYNVRVGLHGIGCRAWPHVRYVYTKVVKRFFFPQLPQVGKMVINALFHCGDGCGYAGNGFTYAIQ